MRQSTLAAALAGAVTVASAGAASAAESAPTGPAQRPSNVVLILADDLSAAELSCYGQKRYRTPNLDRMAAQGMRFTDFYSGAPVCAPSRSVLMTGQHNGHTRVRANGGDATPEMPAPDGRVPLYESDVIVPEVLRSVGYATAGVGKWGLGNEGTTGEPQRQGFDHFFGYLDQKLAHSHYPESLWDDRAPISIPGNAGGKRAVYSHDLFVERSLDFIEQNRNRPFFLYAAWTLPHVELAVPQLAPGLDPALGGDEAIYASMIIRLDAGVGRILDRLDQLGLSKDTLVMFSSDNGTARRSEGVLDGCGPFSGAKYSLQEGGIRVPMICRMPGTVPAGTVSAEPWYAADVLPTLAELSGATPPAALDGISVLPLLTGRSETLPERSLYWETVTKSFSQAARRGSHKALRNWFSGKTALYDLASDPGETRDLAATHPDLVASFEAFMASSHADSPHYPLMVAKCRDWKGEMAAFERELQLKPQDAALLNHYAWFLVDTVPEELKDTTKALDLASKADAAAKSRNRDILDTLSEIHFQRRDYAAAVAYSRKSLEPGLDGKAKPKALQRQLAKCEQALAGVRTTTP